LVIVAGTRAAEPTTPPHRSTCGPGGAAYFSARRSDDRDAE